MDISYSQKPKEWPVNAKEYVLDKVMELLSLYEKEPNYVLKEKILSLVSDYDLNQRTFRGRYRITDYEVALINSLYVKALVTNFNAVRVYLYEIVGESARLQKNVAYMSESFGEEISISISEYEDGLYPTLRLYYFAYLKFSVEKSQPFANQLLSIIEDIVDNISQKDDIDFVVPAYINLLNDISYMHGSSRNGIWKFNRQELFSLFECEAKLIAKVNQSPVVRPLKGVLMTQISNYILKSRNNYNEDYICKYISRDVAINTFENHEIWMRKTSELNDEREQRVIPELFGDKTWIKYSWAKKIDFTAVRTYYVSSFSKSYEKPETMSEYGECIYGYKDDRIVELLAPTIMKSNGSLKNVNSSNNKRIPYLSQVIAFDVIYDKKEAMNELKFLMDVINLFQMTDEEKNYFFEEILQYWILSVKDQKWKDENERRYIIFVYPEYDYLDMNIENGWLKQKTTLFLIPDFVLGDNPVKEKIRKQVDAKRMATSMNDYVYCHNCLSRDYDAVLSDNLKCSICNSTDVELVNLHN